jgi:hypothetical protein
VQVQRHAPRRTHRHRRERRAHFRVYDSDELLTEVARTTTKNIARLKVRKPEPPRRARRSPAESQ